MLVTGTTGSGKSTTLAAMIDRINANRVRSRDHHRRPHRIPASRQEAASSTSAKWKSTPPISRPRCAPRLRQDPDVILVGEMRDLETIATALLAAETGHLVFSTLHTLDATETIQRIIAVFPPPEQKQIRLQLAATLKAVISPAPGAPRRRQGPRARRRSHDRHRLTSATASSTPDKTRLIHDAIAAGTSQYGMQTFDQSLFDLYSKQLITFDEALLRASNPDDFKLRIQGIRSAADSAREEMERQHDRVSTAASQS